MKSRPVSASRTELSQLMTPNDANFRGRVHGGILLMIADRVAYVCAARHAGCYCVTASVDRVDFHEEVDVGEVVTFKAAVNFVGRTSMEVGVRMEAENLYTQEKRHTATCYITMVAVDENNKPVPVPSLLAESEDEKRRFEEGKKRRKLRLAEKGKN